jgi:hypothetical protein
VEAGCQGGKALKYKIKFCSRQRIRITALKFHSWDNASWYLKSVLKFKNENYKFIKNGVEAKIIAANGLPF